MSRKRRREDLLIAILDSIAEERGIELTDLPTLDEFVDVDALLTVLVSGDGVVVSFDLDGETVRIDGDGRVSIE